MYLYNLNLSRVLIENAFINIKTYLAFTLILYLFTLTQESIMDKREIKLGMGLDQVNLLSCTEHLFYLHWSLVCIVYTNNWIFNGSGFLKFNSVSFSIINILLIFFLLAILNIANYYIMPISKMRVNIILLSYYLTLSFMLCNNILLFFILLEIYSILFFLYLIGFNHNLQEILYYLQHDLTVYVFFGLLSTLFFILGIFFIIKDFGVTALNFDVLKVLLESSLIYNTNNNNISDYRGIFLILLSLFVKVGLAPFQGWTVRFFKRTCFQSLVFMLLISKLILIFGAFFTILPVFINITPLLRFIGLFGLVSYVIGSYLVYLKHAESDKLLAYINLTSSGFFFMIFFINNPQTYNFAFIYFSSFMLLMSFTLLLFFSPILNWVNRKSVMFSPKMMHRDLQKNLNVSHGSFFESFDSLWMQGYINLSKHEISKFLLQGVLASLPPTITFYCKVFYDFSFFSSISELTTPYGLILIVGMLTYIITIYGFLALWKQIYLRQGRGLTSIIIKRNMQALSRNMRNLGFARIFSRYSLLLFYIGGFAFSSFEII